MSPVSRQTCITEKMHRKSSSRAYLRISLMRLLPKVNVITGKAFGSAYTIMNSKALGADMTYAWENAEIGMMDARSAAKIMYDGEDAAVINEKAAEYAALQSSAASAARRGYVDTMIDAEGYQKICDRCL